VFVVLSHEVVDFVHQLFNAAEGATANGFLQKHFDSMPACVRMARSVPSGMSPGWLGMVV